MQLNVMWDSILTQIPYILVLKLAFKSLEMFANMIQPTQLHVFLCKQSKSAISYKIQSYLQRLTFILCLNTIEFWTNFMSLDIASPISSSY